MTIDPRALLQTLGGAARTPAPAGAAPVAQQGIDFAALLAKARAGQISSNAPVQAPETLEPRLSADQLSRLSAAADMAEARGISRGVFAIDGRMFTMDVGVRTITGEVRPGATNVLDGIDGVVTVADPGPAQTGVDAARTLLGPAHTLPANASLLRALESRDAHGQGDHPARLSA